MDKHFTTKYVLLVGIGIITIIGIYASCFI